jgi:hypothetical protein
MSWLLASAKYPLSNFSKHIRNSTRSSRFMYRLRGTFDIFQKPFLLFRWFGAVCRIYYLLPNQYANNIIETVSRQVQFLTRRPEVFLIARQGWSPVIFFCHDSHVKPKSLISFLLIDLASFWVYHVIIERMKSSRFDWQWFWINGDGHPSTLFQPVVKQFQMNQATPVGYSLRDSSLLRSRLTSQWIRFLCIWGTNDLSGLQCPGDEPHLQEGLWWIPKPI